MGPVFAKHFKFKCHSLLCPIFSLSVPNLLNIKNSLELTIEKGWLISDPTNKEHLVNLLHLQYSNFLRAPNEEEMAKARYEITVTGYIYLLAGLAKQDRTIMGRTANKLTTT